MSNRKLSVHTEHEFLQKLEDAGLNDGLAQAVIESPGNKLGHRVITFIETGGREFVELPYADEEVKSSYGYPEGWQLKSIQEQLAILQKIEGFKQLDASHVDEVAKKFSELPEGAEGLAVTPKPSRVASSYNEATILMTELMVKHRKDWRNCREGCLGPEYLRLTKKTQQALNRLAKETPGDFLLIPVQTGLRHRGRSVRRARVMMSSNEWGLGPYEVGIILLTHQDRLQRYEDLGIDCAGCEYSPVADGVFSCCLYFDWRDGGLEFYYFWVDVAARSFGSASALG